MLGNKPPYTTMQQLNLDWILSKLKTLLRLVPDDGAVGQILRRTRDGAVWSDEQGGGGGGAVQSVNGKTGAVVLDAADVGALPDDYTPPVTSVNGQTGAVVLDAADVGALPSENLTYTRDGLTPTNCTIIGGGYARIGNIIIVNIRITSTAAGAIVSGFPQTAFSESGNILGGTAYDAINERAAYFYVQPNGQLKFPQALGATGSYLIAFTYLTS